MNYVINKTGGQSEVWEPVQILLHLVEESCALPSMGLYSQSSLLLGLF